MERKKVLQTAIDYTCGDRNDSYGEPHVTMGCIGEMFAVYQKYAGNKHSVGHDACIMQVLTKVGRIACGKLKDDNYIDGAAYIAMAYECDMKRVREEEIKQVNEKAQKIYDGVESLGEGVAGEAQGNTPNSASVQSPLGLWTQFFNATEEAAINFLNGATKSLEEPEQCPCVECTCGPEGKK